MFGRKKVVDTRKTNIAAFFFLSITLFVSSFTISLPQQSFAYEESNEIPIQKGDLLYVTTPLTKKSLEECENIYNDYSNFVKNTFIGKYINHEFVGNCVMLFDDPIWDHQGADRYDKLSEQLSNLVDERIPKQVLMTIEPHIILKISTLQTYLISYDACTLDRAVRASALIVASDTEFVSTIGVSESNLVIPPNYCNVHEVNISASDPNTIRQLIPGAKVLLLGEFKEPILSKTLKATGVNMPDSPRNPEVSVGRLSNLLQVDRPLTENELKQCDAFYQDFLSLDGDGFGLRYRYQKFVGDCVLLYNDPIWNYEVKDRLYTLNQQLAKLRNPPELKESNLAVPEWIKDNAKWWSEGQIGDSDFTNGIQFMIQENIISIPDLPEQASETAEEKVPDWIRNNAGWWANGLISEDDFVNGIKYLVGQGIIRV